MAHIVSIAYKPADLEPKPEDHFARTALSRATLVVGHGIEGDTKGRSDNRQLNLMFAETVAQLRAEGCHTNPGGLGEQIVIAGLSADEVTPGTRLRLGDSARIEITMVRTPCDRMVHIQGKDKDSLRERIGFLARVIHGGDIAIGSAVTIEQTA